MVVILAYSKLNFKKQAVLVSLFRGLYREMGSSSNITRGCGNSGNSDSNSAEFRLRKPMIHGRNTESLLMEEISPQTKVRETNAFRHTRTIPFPRICFAFFLFSASNVSDQVLLHRFLGEIALNYDRLSAHNLGMVMVGLHRFSKDRGSDWNARDEGDEDDQRDRLGLTTNGLVTLEEEVKEKLHYRMMSLLGEEDEISGLTGSLCLKQLIHMY